MSVSGKECGKNGTYLSSYTKRRDTRWVVFAQDWKFLSLSACE